MDLGSRKVKTYLRNIPVWDQEVLLDVYQQLQQLQPYYKFPAVDVDRYTVRGVYQQVFLSPRELDLADLPAKVRNWINDPCGSGRRRAHDLVHSVHPTPIGIWL